MSIRIALAPDGDRIARGSGEAAGQRRASMARSIRDGGGELAALADAEGLVWLDGADASDLPSLLDSHPKIRWVQLPWAGVEKAAAGRLFERRLAFTCAKGSYGEMVAEHALLLALACLRRVAEHARRREWHPLEPVSLFRKRVTILGAGGIASWLVKLLQPFGCELRVLRRSPAPMEGVAAIGTLADLPAALPRTDVLVLALALTPATRHAIGARELALLPRHAVIVNVARGGHIETEALVAALADGTIAAAGLDVTDPEPLPPGHPLWALDNALITSHCADSLEFVTAQLAARVRANVEKFSRGEPLEGLIDPRAGY